MSLEQLEKSVMELTRDQRREFFDWVYEHEDELLSGHDSPEFQAEVLQRISDAERNPDQLIDWDTSMARMKKRFDELNGKKSTAG